MFINPLKLYEMCICASIFISWNRISFISKESVTINKKNMLDFHEKLVLFSMIRRRALKVVIICFMSTEAQLIHLQKIIFRRLRNHREKLRSHWILILKVAMTTIGFAKMGRRKGAKLII